MADNIRIIGNINDIQRVNRLKSEDLNLLDIQVKNQTFGFENDYIEYFVYDGGGNLIDSNYNYRDFKLPSNSFTTPGAKLPIIEIDPTIDLQSLGYFSGQFKTQYNFQTKKVSSPDAELFISKISEDRTEVGIKSTIISSEDLIKYGNNLINELENSIEQKYFILNLSDNTQVLVVNVAVKVEDSSILLKLYEPLNQNIFEKETCWITEELIEPYVFDINLDTSVIPANAPLLRGPNFGIEIDIKQNPNTSYQNYSDLVSSLTGSSYQQVLNYMNDNSYDLNIDYTDFSNFTHFSSVEKRLNIFYNKVKQIENYNNNINVIVGSTNVLKNEQTASIKLQIDNVIKNFDGFENYMYFESSSYAWPKSNSIKPYSLLSTGSANVITWYNNYTGSAENYDENNLDRLYNIIPNYIKNDPDNYQSYYDFVDMIGHYFDNIWIYITSINELYNADNNLEKGISKDIVYDALQSLGVKLYNAKSDDNFNDYIGGLNSGSTLFVDDFSVTSSYLNNIPKKDLLAETYKRIYHNIPLLSKTRGTSIGLQNLINTFGVTGSIFSPKEFGGSTKQSGLKGYDNDKITIKNNTITGSVLSANISLQTTPTSSTEFTSTDLHFIDLSFSPQNELNTRLSASIATLNPTFSIDEYIGDPRLLESSSYASLIQQNNYFTSASAAVSGSEQRLDYKGFIELIKYFDNSLFKMLKDFVPARANALTGVTIKSPILERNKVPVYHPKVEENTVHEAEYAAPTIEEDNSYYYNKLGGNKSSFYTGQITGSYVNVYSYFDDEHINPYLHPTESIDINKFNHTDFNVMLNNVSSSVLSVPRKKLENKYIINNTKVLSSENDIILDAELQDSYLSLKSHQNSRYDGTKIYSLKYNTYTTSSIDYSGDSSFGKTAVIDKYTRKLGLFTQIEQSTFFNLPIRNNVYLKYLVDESGSLTELNKKNKHWHELQNIFKSGEVLTVSQFENQKYSNQKTTDGSKNIFNSGFSYFPILYTSGSDNNLYFNYTPVTGVSKAFKIQTYGGYISGSASLIYPIKSGKIYNLFKKDNGGLDIAVNTNVEGNAFYNSPSVNSFSTYSIQETGNQLFSASFDVTVQFPVQNQSGSFIFNINKVGGSTLASQSIPFTSAYTSVVYTSFLGNYAVKLGDTITISSLLTTYDANGNRTPANDINTTTTLYHIIAYQYIISGDCVTNNIQLVGSKDFYISQYDYYSLNLYCSNFNSTGVDLYQFSSGIKLYELPVSKLTQTSAFNVSTEYQSFTVGDKISFEFITGSGINSFSTSNFTASVSPNGVFYSQLAANQVGTYPYASNSSGTKPFISGSLGGNTIKLSNELSYFQNYQFTPSGSGFTQNSLYNIYGDINYIFNPQPGDVIILYYGGAGNFSEHNIIGTSTNSGSLLLTLEPNLPGGLNIPTYINTTIDKFLILNKINDETNLMLTFDKASGPTSLGLIIPNNLHPDVLNNIDTITKEVKQKLIDFGLPDIGTF